MPRKQSLPQVMQFISHTAKTFFVAQKHSFFLNYIKEKLTENERRNGNDSFFLNK